MTLPEDTTPDQHWDEEHHPRQRASDQGTRYWAGWLYRHLVPAIAIAVAALALGQTQGKIDRQIEGRRIAVDVLCGFGNGVATAGRNVIRGRRADGKPIPGVAFSPREQKIRDAAANDYGAFIVTSVQEQAGVTSVDVIRPDGTLDCPALRRSARTTHP